MSDRHVTRIGDDYAEAMQELLPQGQAWPRHNDSALMSVVRGLTKIWGNFELRASALLEIESDPRKTIELLPDWERNFGLPDPCYAAPTTIEARHSELMFRMTIEGGQSRAFFIDVAAAHIGYTITITEYRPFMVGLDRCGDNRVKGDGTPKFNEWHWPVLDPIGSTLNADELSNWPNYGIGDPRMRFCWTVHVGPRTLTWFRCGGGGGMCGIDPHLRIDRALDLECILLRLKPAHTILVFDYSGTNPPDPMEGTP